MPTPINITIPHTLTVDQARKRLQAIDIPWLASFPMERLEIKAVKKTPVGNIETFIVVTAGEVTLTTDTPLPDLIDRNVVLPQIQRTLEEALK